MGIGEYQVPAFVNHKLNVMDVEDMCSTSGNRCIEDYTSCTTTPGTPHDQDPISPGFNTPTIAHHTHRHPRGRVIAGSAVGASLAALAIATLGIIRLRHHKLQRELMAASEEGDSY